MSVDQVRRGRPKGSGLDDRAYLEALDRLMAGDPTLKPTTAIKKLGITDPSAIRRLRDKLRTGGEAQPLVLVANSAAPSHATIESAAPNQVAQRVVVLQDDIKVELPAASAAAPSVVAPLSVAPATVSPAQAPAAKPREAAQKTFPPPASTPVSAEEAMAEAFAKCCALGLFAAQVTAEAQLKVLEDLLKVPPFAVALKQHVYFNEVAKAFYPALPGTPDKRH